MHLNILARSDVCDTDRILFGDVRHHLELIRRHEPQRDFDPLHLHAVLALTVHTMAKPKFQEYLLGHLVVEESDRVRSRRCRSRRAHSREVAPNALRVFQCDQTWDVIL